MKPQRNSLSLFLTFALILPAGMPLGQAQTMPAALNIVVVEGEGAIYSIGQRGNHIPIVRVEDENHKPVAGAAVVFTLPTEGATGEFGNGSKNLTIVADGQGLAKANGLRVNQSGGKLPIHVTASYRGLAATTTITQFVEATPGAKASSGSGHGHGKVIAILAAIGAAAAGGAVYAMQKSSSGATPAPSPPSGPTPIGITPGTGTIAPPR